MTAYDAIIIGTGQAGPPLARRLAGKGMKVTIIERGRFGGTCINNGCTPTKTLVASAYVARIARRAKIAKSAPPLKIATTGKPARRAKSSFPSRAATTAAPAATTLTTDRRWLALAITCRPSSCARQNS